MGPQRRGRGRRGQGQSSSVAFDVDGVNSVLDEVRPYLIADGGNVMWSALRRGW